MMIYIILLEEQFINEARPNIWFPSKTLSAIEWKEEEKNFLCMYSPCIEME
jgi:hypothetical protein